MGPTISAQQLSVFSFQPAHPSFLGLLERAFANAAVSFGRGGDPNGSGCVSGIPFYVFGSLAGSKNETDLRRMNRRKAQILLNFCRYTGKHEDLSKRPEQAAFRPFIQRNNESEKLRRRDKVEFNKVCL